MSKKTRIKKTLKNCHEDTGQINKLCDHPECIDSAQYPAPKSRFKLDDYLWFCLNHVKEYNRRWNYYEDMSDDEFEDNLLADRLWQRPTWRFQTSTKASQMYKRDFYYQERKKIFDDFFQESKTDVHHAHLSKETRKSLSVFNLDYPFTIKQLKSRYKELAKKYHPDRNCVDKTDIEKKHFEEMLKKINKAYSVLKEHV